MVEDGDLHEDDDAPSMTLRRRRMGISVKFLAPRISHAMLLLYPASVSCVLFFCRVLTLSGGGPPLYGPNTGPHRMTAVTLSLHVKCALLQDFCDDVAVFLIE